MLTGPNVTQLLSPLMKAVRCDRDNEPYGSPLYLLHDARFTGLVAAHYTLTQLAERESTSAPDGIGRLVSWQVMQELESLIAHHRDLRNTETIGTREHLWQDEVLVGLAWAYLILFPASEAVRMGKEL